MVTISLKDGVSIHGLTPEMAFSIAPIYNVCQYFGIDLVITSCNDGQHMEGSFHPKGDAFDIRTRDLPNEAKKVEMRVSLAAALGPDFDVVLESDHMHIERDPE